MAGKNWQAGGRNTIPAGVVACLFAVVAPFHFAFAAGRDPELPAYLSTVDPSLVDPSLVWEGIIGGLAVYCLLVSITLWIVSAVHKAKRAQLRRNAFVSSALNNLNQGVVITDPRKRIVFCNDQFLEMYGLARSDLTPQMTGREMLDLLLKRGAVRAPRHDQILSAAERRFGGDA
jgi:PAS domain-containing protein